MQEILNHYRLPGLPVVCSEFPAGGSAETARAKLGVLAQYEPAVIVNLTNAADQAPAYDPAALRLPVGGWEQGRWAPTLLSRPIPDAGAPASVEAFAAIVEEIAQLRGWVAVHCRGGIGRTGMVAAGLLVRSGWGADEALETINALWRSTPKGQSSMGRFLRAPETEVQWQMVRAYAEVAKRAAPMPLAPRRVAGQWTTLRCDARSARACLIGGAAGEWRAVSAAAPADAVPVLALSDGVSAIAAIALRNLTEQWHGVSPDPEALDPVRGMPWAAACTAGAGVALEPEPAFRWSAVALTAAGHGARAAMTGAALATLVSHRARGASLQDAVSRACERLLRETGSREAAEVARTLSYGHALGSMCGTAMTPAQFESLDGEGQSDLVLSAAAACAAAHRDAVGPTVALALQARHAPVAVTMVAAQLAALGAGLGGIPEGWRRDVPAADGLRLLADDLSFGGPGGRWWTARWLPVPVDGDGADASRGVPSGDA